MKEPKCSFCGKTGHYKINCFEAPRKPIKSNVKQLKKTPLKRPATKTSVYPSKPKPSLRTPVSQRKQYIKELDSIFSKYIRLKASKNGVAMCVTCAKFDSWKFMDCGHFIVRGKIGTRFDERNCHVQCRDCNRLKQGNMKRYEQYMKAKYGPKILDELKVKSKTSLKTYEIEAMIKYYKEKLLTLTK